MLLTGLGGGLDLWLRQKLYRWLFYRMGRGVAIGRYVTLRAPFRIALGNRVVVEDFVLLDGRGTPENPVNLVIGDDVFIGRGTHLVCRGGTIHVGTGVNIGPNCLIQSAREVVLEDRVLLAPFVYITGATQTYDRLDVPVIGQPTSSQGVRIGRGTWIGATYLSTTAFASAGTASSGPVPSSSTTSPTMPSPTASRLGSPACGPRRRVRSGSTAVRQ